MAKPRDNKLRTKKEAEPNRFYLGSHDITQRFTVGGPAPEGDQYPTTLENAVDMAVERCKTSGEPQIVVQIVRVVRSSAPPVEIEVIK